MTVMLLDGAYPDIDQAFEYYESRRRGLGDELLEEFRRGIDQSIGFPEAWHPIDETYRSYRLNRFPYAIVYRVDNNAKQIIVLSLMHLSREPGTWRKRDH
jgi:toxin ParE1/3/4